MSTQEADAQPTPHIYKGGWQIGPPEDGDSRRQIYVVPEDATPLLIAKCYHAEELIAAAGTAAHELPDEYDILTILRNLSEILDAVRRANIDLSDVQALVARNELHNNRTIDAAKERLDNIHEVARGESDALDSAEGGDDE